MQVICEETQKTRQLKEGQTVSLGRRREWGITDQSVSRRHCQILVKEAEKVEVKNAEKEIMIERSAGKRMVKKKAGSTTTIKVGDWIRIPGEEGVSYGFELRRLRPASPPKAPVRKRSGMFEGDRFVFLTKSHIGVLRKKLLERGGEVVEKLDADVDYAMVSNETLGVFEALVELYKDVKFVLTDFVSDSVIAGRKLDDKRYLAYKTKPERKRKLQSPDSPMRIETENVDASQSDDLAQLPSDYDWIEVYDPYKAQETVDKLFHHWTHYRTTQTAVSLSEESDQESDLGESSTAPKRNNVCSHVACSAVDVCFIEHLSQVKHHYHGSRVDQFKIKAIDKAIRVLEALNSSLISAEHIERLNLGKKTTDKLLQILNTGHVQRNKELAHDQHEQLFHSFSQVWGAGNATAQKWLAAGCTCLSDVAARSDLTELQCVGVKYFEDFQQKIPRQEVLQIYSTVKKAVIHVIAQLTHSTVHQSEVP